MNRIAQLFQAEDGQLSMTRLLLFMSFFPASYVIIMERSEGTLALYLGAYATSYVLGKYADMKGIKDANSRFSD